MSLKQLITPFAWTRYSRKLGTKMDKLRYAGSFTSDRGMRLIKGEEGSITDGNYICLYWLVDGDDGVIADAKFQAFGQSALIAAGEVACELVLGKNYDQAKRLTTDLIDKQLRDHSDEQAFPSETYPHLNLVLSAIDHAAEQCTDIPLADSYVAPPLMGDLSEILEGGYPGWLDMSEEGKLAVIEQVLDNDIRPYIALDAGGVKVKKLEGLNLVITYQGTCTSCMSSVGATLSYIQQMLKNKVYPDLKVTPDL